MTAYGKTTIEFCLSTQMDDASWSPMFPVSDFDPLLAKLQKLAHLPDGWEYGKGKPTHPHVYKVACSIYQRLASSLWLQADAFPCADGSLYLVFYSGQRCVEIRIWAHGGIDLSVEEGFGQDFQELLEKEDVSLDEIEKVVFSFLIQGSNQWHLSDSSTHSITTCDVFDSAALVLAIPAMEQEYPSLIPSASKQKPPPYVTT